MKWIVALFFHSIMLGMLIVGLLFPYMLYTEWDEIIKKEIPSDMPAALLLGLAALFIYIATKSDFFGKPYKKITILLPLLHLCIYTSLAMIVAIKILNTWADAGSMSKGLALTLATLSFIGIRLLISVLYWKYPISSKRYD
ncbi:hypothetical protein [Paenibacillus daejeonensis]|uniref:hypothetical protein n=1 Tax=Paenibacillus daejeonensis TaxID=135193 RepID=UPI00036A4844|nr:hypothetical protein [Paenibacillus daejeonensis]